MRFSIDDTAVTSSGLSLFSSDDVLRAGAVAAANAGRVAVHAVADEDARLRAAVDRFVRAHVHALDVSAAAAAALARKLTSAAHSAHEAELAAADQLGAAGLLAPDGAPWRPAGAGRANAHGTGS